MSETRCIDRTRRRQSTISKQACDACKIRKKCRGPRRRTANLNTFTQTISPRDTPTSQHASEDNQNHLHSTEEVFQPSMQDITNPPRLDEPTESRPGPSRNFSHLLNSDAISPVSLLSTTPASHDQNNTYETTTTQHSNQHSYRTDVLCSRLLLNRIMSDYLDLIYPVIPVVHRPSFQRDLAREIDCYDTDFFMLLIGLCAVTVAICSSKFDEYRSIDPSMTFESTQAMINHCYDLSVCSRGPSYFDQVSHQKFAVSYCLVTALFQVGHHNRSRVLEAETMQLARMLELHRPSAYENLDYIEAQLRKKAFWLIFYSLVHNKLQYARRERLLYLDCSVLRTMDFSALLPAEVEDECITAEGILPQATANQVNVITAFNIHSKVFCAVLMPIWRIENSAPDLARAESNHNCGCECFDTQTQISYLQDRLEELRYMLDDAPPNLRQWAPHQDVDRQEPTRVGNTQMEIVRANIHVTHLWLQSMILDKIDALRMGNSALSDPDPKATWNQREDISRQLLHVLHSFPDEPLEPNGYHTFCKIRDVAVALLSCPFDTHDRVAVRANEYLHRFTEILWRLDKSELLNSLSLQNWIDTGRQW